MDQRCHTFSFRHYHQAPGASCGILYILVLSLVLFMQSLYPLFNLWNFSFTCIIMIKVELVNTSLWIGNKKVYRIAILA